MNSNPSKFRDWNIFSPHSRIQCHFWRVSWYQANNTYFTHSVRHWCYSKQKGDTHSTYCMFHRWTLELFQTSSCEIEVPLVCNPNDSLTSSCSNIRSAFGWELSHPKNIQDINSAVCITLVYNCCTFYFISEEIHNKTQIIEKKLVANY